ncbi:MAG: DUF3800 domain-containing protein [Alphaproteobacteria bacterium HGW-Alphaproteobacteria-7]|jgi:hypothetical protein|nr:MAG: DUF3800 domain-containing protein [Alphaproteobacteria bacterium HGW-Alphaproteobacteria-7]
MGEPLPYSDYIVFADESGDHGLDKIDPEFPMFALSFCMIEKAAYISSVVPAFQQFKFDFWGHDGVVLHEHEIRKRKGPFTLLLTNPDLRASFYERLNGLMADTPMSIVASVIDKVKLKAKYAQPSNPYEIALLFCMERLLGQLLAKGQSDRTVHVLFESRGKQEDADLELEFRRICANQRNWGWKQTDFTQIRFEPVFVKKAANATGLQLSDLTARPIALHYLRPDQSNRAYDTISTKLRAVKCFP